MFCNNNTHNNTNTSTDVCTDASTGTDINAIMNSTGSGNMSAATAIAEGDEDLFFDCSEPLKSDGHDYSSNNSSGNRDSSGNRSSRNTPAKGTPAGKSKPSKGKRVLAYLKKVNWVGIAAFILAVISIGFGGYYFIMTLIALVLSFVGLYEMKRCRHFNAFAVAAITITGLSVSIWLMIIFLGVGLVGAAVAYNRY